MEKAGKDGVDVNGDEGRHGGVEGDEDGGGSNDGDGGCRDVGAQMASMMTVRGKATRAMETAAMRAAAMWEVAMETLANGGGDGK